MRAAALAALGLLLAAPVLAGQGEMQRLLALSSNWTYQLQSANVGEIAATGYDVVVMDLAGLGARHNIEALKRKPGGGRRLVLAYLSVGEAEVYRYYWSICCAAGKRPSWLGPENPRWKGNYKVQFWEDEWRGILFEDKDSYLLRIVEAGFDGVYLDRVDAHAGVSAAGIDGKMEMVRLVKDLADKARKLKPDILLVAQNAEELLGDDAYLAAIDGIAKEDLLYGSAGEGKRNTDDKIRSSRDQLARAHEQGKHVMVVEYLQKPDEMAVARTEIMEMGFVPTFAPRTLHKLQIENLEDDGSH